ncbi:MAG: hypothetical protein QMB16_10520 [Paracoccaceae bacterium]|jgi:hypothetical protein
MGQEYFGYFVQIQADQKRKLNKDYYEILQSSADSIDLNGGQESLNQKTHSAPACEPNINIVAMSAVRMAG